MTQQLDMRAYIRWQDNEPDPVPALRSVLDPDGPTILTATEFADFLIDPDPLWLVSLPLRETGTHI